MKDVIIRCEIFKVIYFKYLSTLTHLFKKNDTLIIKNYLNNVACKKTLIIKDL